MNERRKRSGRRGEKQSCHWKKIYQDTAGHVFREKSWRLRVVLYCECLKQNMGEDTKYSCCEGLEVRYTF